MVRVEFDVRVWKDKNKTWLMYSKKFGISAYGKTRKQAREMFVVQVYDFIKSTMPKKKK